MTDKSFTNIWIGLATVRPFPDNDQLGDALGAYVQVLSVAEDAASFTTSARLALHDSGFECLAFEDIENFDERRGRQQLSKDMLALANQAFVTGECQYGSFHSFDE